MRQPRIKVPPDEGPGVYHAISRTVNGEMLFDDEAKEMFRRMLWQVADYAGVQVYTYAVLTNHFHVLIGVPRREPVSDEELLRRFEVLYPDEPQQLNAIKAQLKVNGSAAAAWRKQQLALMGDISPCLQLLKQRFTIWFNKNRNRFGTLWCERFKSVLVQPTDSAIEAVAAYIDLNCVRAGLSKDPKDYRFCGYAEAVKGSASARRGIAAIRGGEGPWEKVQAGYRQVLFAVGSQPREHGAVISREDYLRVMREGGRLDLAAVLRCRIRYFTDGAVLGSRSFVESQLLVYRRRSGHGMRMVANDLPPVTDWGGLMTMRRLRGLALS